MADCSKTLDFCKEFDRLCNFYNMECNGCPLEHSNYNCDGYNITQEAIDIVQKWSDENPYIPKLKPCPFCGKTTSVEIDRYSEYDDNYTSQYAVICNHNKGGCGSVSGYKNSKTEAIELWNTRAEEG